MIYFLGKLDEKSNPDAYQADFIPHAWQLKCNNLPQESVTTF